MSNRIEKYDLISQEAQQTIQETATQFRQLITDMQAVVKVGADLKAQLDKQNTSLSENAKNTEKVNDNTNKLVVTAR